MCVCVCGGGVTVVWWFVCGVTVVWCVWCVGGGGQKVYCLLVTVVWCGGGGAGCLLSPCDCSMVCVRVGGGGRKFTVVWCVCVGGEVTVVWCVCRGGRKFTVSL